MHVRSRGGFVEGLGRAARAFPGVAAGIEAAGPAPRVLVVQAAGADRDGAHVHVAEIECQHSSGASGHRRRVRAGMPHDPADLAGGEAASGGGLAFGVHRVIDFCYETPWLPVRRKALPFGT
jgi:hypothetical protein